MKGKVKRALEAEKRRNMRVQTWGPFVKEESFMMELIKFVVDIECQYALTCNVPQFTPQMLNLPSTYHQQVLRQSSHAYHSLYGGCSDEVIVVASTNQSINKRNGIITQFFPEKSAYGVRLATKRISKPSLYGGEYHVIPLKYLMRSRQREGHQNDLPHVFHVIITTLKFIDKSVEATFPITRDMIDTIR